MRQRRRFSDHLYALLLSLFPREFRGDFGDDMADTFRQQRGDVKGFATGRLWARTSLDLIRQAPREHLDLLWRDVVYAARLMRRTPGFTAVAVLTLALGIGTNITIFAFADGMLFRRLPFREPHQLVLVQTLSQQSGQVYTRVARIDFERIRDHHRGIADIATLRNLPAFTWRGTDGLETMSASEGTPNLLYLLGVVPHAGRVLGPGDEAREPRPAMLTFAAWRARFGSDPTIIGRTIAFEDGRVQIVGVLPQGFIHPIQGSLANGELLFAARRDPLDAGDARAGVWSPIARLRAGVSVQQAQTEMDLLMAQARQEFPGLPERALRVAQLQFALFELSRPLLWLLVGAAGFVLLIACANLTTLLIARATAREHEVRIRFALGASRGRIARQLIVESAVVGLMSGVIALPIASLTFHTLGRYAPNWYRLVPESLNARAVVFAALLSACVGLLIGVLSALRSSTKPGISVIREQDNSARSTAGFRAGSVLVALEITLATILLAGMGLMVNSLIRMRSVDLGFDEVNRVLMDVRWPRSQDLSVSLQREHFGQLLQSVRRMPGVQVAAAIEYGQVGSAAPPAGFRSGPHGAGIWRVTPAYFQAMGIPLLRGRDFTAEDVASDAPVAIVNESIVRYLWPDGFRADRQLQLDDATHVTVIGVVKDLRSGYGRPIRPSIYRPMTGNHVGSMIVARTSIDSAVIAPLLRAEARRLEPRVIIPPPQALSTLLDAGISGRQFETGLFVMFGSLGLIVAVIGVYGLMALWVGGRTREFGVRISLGATATQIKVLVLRQSGVPVAGGAIAGLVGATLLTRRLESLLYEITPHDAPTLVTVVSVLVTAGLAAAYLPARRATRVDPAIALRSE